MNRCLLPKLKPFLKPKGTVIENAEELDQVLRLESELSSVHAVQIRSAYTRVCALELFVSNANMADIAKAASETDFKAVLQIRRKFCCENKPHKKLC